MQVLGLRTIIYPAPDLEASKAWFAALLGIDPYFDEPFYVGFNLAGYELGLDPDGDPATGPVTTGESPTPSRPWQTSSPQARSRGLRCATSETGFASRASSSPEGRCSGVIENPHFEAAPAHSAGPGL